MCGARAGAIPRARAHPSSGGPITRLYTWPMRTQRPMRGGRARTFRARRSGSTPPGAAWMERNTHGGMSSRPAAGTWPTPGRASSHAENLALDGFAGTAPVGSFPANGYGLYEMTGNTWEWTADPYSNHPETQHACCGAGPAHHPAQCDEGRLAPVRRQLLPALPPGGPDGAAGGHLDVAPWHALRRAPLGAVKPAGPSVSAAAATRRMCPMSSDSGDVHVPGRRNRTPVGNERTGHGHRTGAADRPGVREPPVPRRDHRRARTAAGERHRARHRRARRVQGRRRRDRGRAPQQPHRGRGDRARHEDRRPDRARHRG